MQKDLLKYTQELDGYQVVGWKALVDRCVVLDDMTALQRLAVRRNAKATLNVWIERSAPHRCPECGCETVSVYAGRERIVRGLPVCNIPTVIHVTSHRTYCPDCGRRHQESLPFLSHPKARVTKQLERTIMALRGEMSISAISDYYDLDWNTVKNIEKRRLAEKYAHVPLNKVNAIGIDEIQAFPSARGGQQYVTVVRDLETGDVLHVTDGKGSAVLADFGKEIHRWRRRIKYVCMDMSNAYAKWVREYLPKAQVVYDHFHVIKAMNDKLDAVRRRTMNQMETGIKSSIKGCRRILTANESSLDAAGRSRLAELRATFSELSDVHAMKEMLRGIYSFASIEYSARLLLEDWCETARATQVPELEAMARTITEHMEGILGYWRFDGASNASTEGFNNKIRWLITQAYGLRDREYFKLKVFSLPTLKTSKSL